MDFSDWFNFSQRVKQDHVLVKVTNGQADRKTVRGSINWLALIFTFFYALFSQKYRTPGFIQKAAVPFVALIGINMIAEMLVGSGLQVVINLAGAVWYGLMFDTWFENQLLANGYQIETTQPDSTVAH